MYLNILVVILISESDLISAYILLNFWQNQYAYCHFGFAKALSSKPILPINLKIGDRNAQPRNQSESNRNWYTNQKI